MQKNILKNKKKIILILFVVLITIFVINFRFKSKEIDKIAGKYIESLFINNTHIKGGSVSFLHGISFDTLNINFFIHDSIYLINAEFSKIKIKPKIIKLLNSLFSKEAMKQKDLDAKEIISFFNKNIRYVDLIGNVSIKKQETKQKIILQNIHSCLKNEKNSQIAVYSESQKIVINDTIIIAEKLKDCTIITDHNISSDKISLRCFGGNLNMGYNYDFGNDTCNIKFIDIKKVNLYDLYTSFPFDRDLRISGILDSKISCNYLLSRKNIYGTGNIQISELCIKNSTFQKSSTIKMIMPFISKLDFKKVYTDLKFVGNHVVNNINARSQNMDLKADGKIFANGAFDQNLKLYLDNKMQTKYSSFVNNFLILDYSNKKKYLKIKAKGTYSQPRIIISRDNINKGINNIFNKIKSQISTFLK